VHTHKLYDQVVEGDAAAHRLVQNCPWIRRSDKDHSEGAGRTLLLRFGVISKGVEHQGVIAVFNWYTSRLPATYKNSPVANKLNSIFESVDWDNGQERTEYFTISNTVGNGAVLKILETHPSISESSAGTSFTTVSSILVLP
jgi:hypothetical protein